MYFYINRFIIIILFNAVISGYSSNENSVFINITKQETNKLKVTYRYKKNIPNRNIFYFPRTVMGAYSDIPYTEYISDFAVYYNNGTSKSFSISKNKVDLSGIEYIDSLEFIIKSSWKKNDHNESNIFEPEAIFVGDDLVLNFGSFGFFDVDQEKEHVININKWSKDIKYSTSMKMESENFNNIVFSSPTFNEMVDQPVFIGQNVKVSSFYADDIEVEIALISEVDRFTNDSLSQIIEPVVRECKKLLPKKIAGKYCFLFYITKDNPLHFGALEHNRSSLFYMGLNPYNFNSTIEEIAAHEFIHLLTPLHISTHKHQHLNLHDPKFSKHLWFYEGLTEYLSVKSLSNLVLARSNDSLYFFRKIMYKNSRAKEFDNSINLLSMSEHIDKEENQENFGNIYNKAPVIWTVLDYHLLNETNGGVNLDTILRRMINYTQVNGCFKEENLIDLIDQYSDGILGKYIDSFIVNNSVIDIELYFNNIGIELYKDTVSFDDCRYYHPTFRFGGKKLILTNSYLNETLGVKKLKILRIEGVDVEAKPTWVSMNLSGSQKDSLLLEVEIKGEIEKLVAYPKCKKVTIYPTKLRINSHSRFTEVFELLN